MVKVFANISTREICECMRLIVELVKNVLQNYYLPALGKLRR